VNKLSRSLLCCGLLSLCSVVAQARELKVGVDSYPPYYFEQQGKMRGAMIEIAQHIASKLGHTLVFKKYPWPRIQAQLRYGGIDMVMLYFKTQERDIYAVYTDTPHLYDSSYLVTRKNAEVDYDGDLSTLKNYRFGNIRGYSHGIKYDSDVMLSKHKATDEKQLIRMLLKGRIDIAVGNKAVMTLHAESYGVLNQIDFLSPAIDRTPAFFAFSRQVSDSKQLAAQFSIAVKQLIATEQYQQILEKYAVE